MNFYNENDPYAAQWLRNLAQAGHIVPGQVVERSIKDIEPWEVPVDGQAHFFAGIGVWSRALRLAGWPDGLPVWTGSCPCQPFSQAGRGGGFNDDRHLWPAWHPLIRECRPSIIFGEQVASPDGLRWLDSVCADLEAEGYAVGAADTCAAGVGAPHLRQRLYFMAYRTDARLEGTAGPRVQAGEHGLASRTAAGKLGDDDDAGPQRRLVGWHSPGERSARAAGLVDPWQADWLWCRDGKYRAVRPGTFPLAHGAPSRVGRLRAFGNALVAQQAAQFIAAAMDSLALLE